eukprot:CAMPEP_0174856446 /NCGR_PEP_ID=MMETSP1114-20130205/35949_1 /TAXON_ID=312471 /ORGANISM="Neobodo designis, Strain CCAP 1951/1" /LENGTH=143 /DNA_ID=CAMNT_0016091245 /DNA_START=527 /DNA_END=955 /DNA_ORIENTATION=+
MAQISECAQQSSCSARGPARVNTCKENSAMPLAANEQDSPGVRKQMTSKRETTKDVDLKAWFRARGQPLDRACSRDTVRHEERKDGGEGETVFWFWQLQPHGCVRAERQQKRELDAGQGAASACPATFRSQSVSGEDLTPATA